jgi:hypothetical protein
MYIISTLEKEDFAYQHFAIMCKRREIYQDEWKEVII